jgi:hypothetical protein
MRMHAIVVVRFASSNSLQRPERLEPLALARHRGPRVVAAAGFTGPLIRFPPAVREHQLMTPNTFLPEGLASHADQRETRTNTVWSLFVLHGTLWAARGVLALLCRGGTLRSG